MRSSRDLEGPVAAGGGGGGGAPRAGGGQRVRGGIARRHPTVAGVLHRAYTLINGNARHIAGNFPTQGRGLAALDRARLRRERSDRRGGSRRRRRRLGLRRRRWWWGRRLLLATRREHRQH